MNVVLGAQVNWLGDPGARAARGDPRRRLAHDAVRRAVLLRAAPHDPGRASTRRRPSTAPAPGHARASSRCRCSGRCSLVDAALPHARCAPRLRPHVRAHRRRPGRHDGDAHASTPTAASSRRSASGFGSAIGVVVFALVMLVAAALPRVLRRREAADVKRSAAGPPTSRCSRCSRSTPCRSSGSSSRRSSPRPSCCACRRSCPSPSTLAHYEVVFAQSSMPRALLQQPRPSGSRPRCSRARSACRPPTRWRRSACLPPRLLMLGIVASTAFPQIATVSPLYLVMRGLGLRDTWTALVPRRRLVRAAVRASGCMTRLHARDPARARRGRGARRRGPLAHRSSRSICR